MQRVNSTQEYFEDFVCLVLHFLSGHKYEKDQLVVLVFNVIRK